MDALHDDGIDDPKARAMLRARRIAALGAWALPLLHRVRWLSLMASSLERIDTARPETWAGLYDAARGLQDSARAMESVLPALCGRIREAGDGLARAARDDVGLEWLSANARSVSSLRTVVEEVARAAFLVGEWGGGGMFIEKAMMARDLAVVEALSEPAALLDRIPNLRDDPDAAMERVVSDLRRAVVPLGSSAHERLEIESGLRRLEDGVDAFERSGGETTGADERIVHVGIAPRGGLFAGPCAEPERTMSGVSDPALPPAQRREAEIARSRAEREQKREAFLKAQFRREGLEAAARAAKPRLNTLS